MRAQVIVALRALVLFTVIGGVLFPLAMTGAAQLLFRADADGSLVHDDGRLVGSALVGQAFTGDEHFHPRPSAAGAAASGSFVEGPDGEPIPADDEDLTVTASGASNLGPSNPVLLDVIAERAEAYRATNGLAADAAVPVDAVTASASGLDPHISVANARIQATRVARVRGLDLDEVLALVDDHTHGRTLGLFGEPAVNVLTLNLALDRQDGGR